MKDNKIYVINANLSKRTILYKGYKEENTQYRYDSDKV